VSADVEADAQRLPVRESCVLLRLGALAGIVGYRSVALMKERRSWCPRTPGDIAAEFRTLEANRSVTTCWEDRVEKHGLVRGKVGFPTSWRPGCGLQGGFKA